MVQHVTTGYFGNSCGYSAVQSHSGAVVPPISGFGPSGNTWAFRGTYMRRMHTFLEESDAASLRRCHCRCAQDIAARMSWTSLLNAENRMPDASSRPKISRRSISQAWGSTKSAAVACSSRVTGTVRPHGSEGNTIRALM